MNAPAADMVFNTGVNRTWKYDGLIETSPSFFRLDMQLNSGDVHAVISYFDKAPKVTNSARGNLLSN